MEKTFDKETLKSILGDVYLDLVSIADAPSKNDPYFDEAEEKQKYYKAIDAHGVVYLARNPALMVLQAARFQTPIVRELPKRMLSYDEAKSGLHKHYSSDSAFQEPKKRKVNI
jgi:hypothetical protein